MDVCAGILGWASMASIRFWRFAIVLSFVVTEVSRPLMCFYKVYNYWVWVSSIVVYDVCSSDMWVCCPFCIFYSSNTVRYASVRVFVNSASVLVLFTLSFSSTVNRSSILELLDSIHSSRSVTSLRILETSTRVVDAAALSVFIIFLLSPIP
jgi:hypothetical protein